MTPELRTLTARERFDWLRLSRSGSVGPRTFFGLLQRFGTAAAAIEALPDLGRRAPGRAVQLAAVADVDRELVTAQRAGVRFIALCEPEYPPSLRVIDSAPPLVAVRGRVDVLQRTAVAIVGSRNASAAGLVMTERLAAGIGAAGHVIVSGLARGIDARAHAASLSTGTVAVLAGGHDRIYPSEHAGLAARIVEDGALLSEMPFGWEPRARDFPRRNRIVSGLSLGTVVVEAARRSGSLITARFANEQGREVFAVPGSPLDLRAEGTNDLLRQGATFCTGADDVVEALRPAAASGHPGGQQLREPAAWRAEGEPLWDELDLDGPDLSDPAPPDEPDAGTARARIEALVGTAPVSVDDLVRVSGLSAQTIQGVILEMELDGAVVRQGAGTLARRPGGR